MSFFKSALAAAFLAGLGTVGISGTASAGTWYLNARACPDLREDRRDRRVIDCPRRAWTYVPDRWERRNGIERGSGGRLGSPGIVYRRHGNFYRETRRGDLRQIDVVIERGRRGYRDRGRGYRDRHGYRNSRYNNHRGYRY